MKLNEVNSQKNFSFSCIYLWTNLINQKKYVGQARSFYNRMGQYKLGKFNPHMRNAIRKYGIDNFEITILEKDLSIETLNDREQFWMDYYKSYEIDNGYNICKVAGTTAGRLHSKETKSLLSKIAKERFKNKDNRVKVSGRNNGMYGKKHSEEWKKNHSNFLKEKWKEEEYRKFWTEKMSGENNHMFGVHLYGELNGMFGKTHSEETRKKISENLPQKKKVICIETNEIFDSITQASEIKNVSRCGINSVCKGKSKTSGGLHWEYVEP